MSAQSRIYEVGMTFGNDWNARRHAARLYLARHPWTRRAAFFRSVIRAADKLSPEPFQASPPTEGGRPTPSAIGAVVTPFAAAA